MQFGTVESLGAVTLKRSNGGTPTTAITLDSPAFTAGAAAVTLTAANGVAATNDGSSLALVGGNGNTSGNGGALSFTSGAGGATGAGGGITLTAANGGATSGDGGAVAITAGSGGGNGNGNGVTILAGNGTTGANVGGNITLAAGQGAATGNGGDVNFASGEGGGTSGNSGNITFTPGSVTSGAQGTIILIAPGGGTAPALRFREDAASGTNYFSLQAAAAMAANNPYTWPDAYPGTSGFALTSTTAGVLSWAAVTSSVQRFAFTLTEAGSDNFTVTHSFGLTGNFTVSMTLQDNNTLQVVPDSVTFTSGNAITINLASYRAANGGTLPAGFVGVVLG